MIDFYTIYGSRARSVHWMLEEIGAPFRIHVLDYKAGAHKQPAYLAVNPMGKVPAIVHDGTVVTEAGAICTYLAECFPEAGLAPLPGAPDRAAYLRWMFFGAACMDAAVVDRMFDRPPLSPVSASPYRELPDVLAIVEDAVARHDWLLGDRFSAADVYVGTYPEWAAAKGLVALSPVLADYVARIRARPAFQRAQPPA